MPIQKEFNKKFFKQWSPEMAYILGFLFADGNMVKTKRNTYFVGWYSGDEELLRLMARAMESNHKIGVRALKNLGVGVYVLQIGSKELFEDLVKLGLTPNKTRRMELPEIPNKYIGPFIRGYFDGDGNVWSGFINIKRKKPSLVLSVAFTCASQVFLENLRMLLRGVGLMGGGVYKIKNKECSRLQYSTRDALKLYEIMYNGSHSLFLPRKRLVFEKFLKMRP